jgi:ribosomal protein L37AE/L43A
MKVVKVKIEQAGGKYGLFSCPVCQAQANYKFTAASGWCDACDSSFTYFGGANLTGASVGKFGTHWIELQVEQSENAIS